jgi:tetrahydromethanopterin S-methyltransferase subunit F
MRTIMIVTALLMWPGYGALAQDQPMRPGATPEPESEATEALPEVENQRRVEELREELKELLEQSREGAEDLVRDFQVSAGLTDSQIYGIAAGIVVGAVLADLMGGNGLATLALAAGGGALGNWIMSD